MTSDQRKRLNQQVGALAFGRLRLDKDTYRTIVASLDETSDGHLTKCSDANAKLVLLALEGMAAGSTDATSVIVKNPRQQKFIARLMDYLGWTWKDTARFCLHQTGKQSTKLCNAGELSKVIIGMIRIIDDRIEKGRLLLTEVQLKDYQHHTSFERKTQSQTEAPCPSGPFS